MKIKANPDTAHNANRAAKKRSGPFEIGSPKPTCDGADKSKNATNKISKDPGRSPQVKAPNH